MKNKIYYLGIVATFIITIGCVFKIMHWPFAGIAIFIGSLLLCFGFIPLAFKSNIVAEADKKHKTFYVLAAIVLVINIISVLFKIMHWPFAGILILIAVPLPFVVLLPVYLKMNKEDKQINYKNFTAVMFFFAYLAVISALLTLNVSYNVIDSYIKSEQNLNEKTRVIALQCETIEKSLQQDFAYVKMHSSDNQLIASEVKKLVSQIDSLKALLIGVYTPNSIEKTKIDLKAIKNKDARVSLEPYIMHGLKTNLENYKSILKKANVAAVDEIVNTNSPESCSWEESFFSNCILVSAIEKLTLLQYQVRMGEYMALTSNI